MKKLPPRTSTTAQSVHPDQLRKSLAHPEWFHITRDDAGATQLSVHILRVPPPDRTLVATWCAASVQEHIVNLLFGQSLPGQSRLNGLMNVTMAVTHVQRTIYASDEFLAQLDTFAEGHGITPTVRAIQSENFPSERIVIERAAIVSISFSGEDAELRFFRVSPTDLSATTMGQTGVPVLYPVVQVIMDTSELVHLIHALTSAVPKGTL